MKCPACGAAQLVRDTRDLAHTDKGETTIIPNVTGQFCPACDEAVLDADESTRVSAAMRVQIKKMALATDNHQPRQGRKTGGVISWYHSNPALSNANCLYCGQLLTGPAAPQSDKEHLIARKFVPASSMSDTCFNFLFRACRTCNARKANAERHVSSVTLFNSPSRTRDPRADHSAKRKGAKDFSPRKPGVLIQNAHEELKHEFRHPHMTLTFSSIGPPQLDRGYVEEVALCHIQGLFALITSTDFRDSMQMRLLPQDQFFLYGTYPHQDWGNLQAIELAQRVKAWDCVANINSADGYFRAIMRRHETGWFWALEWNKHLRLIGGIGQLPMQVFEDLPSEGWQPTPTGRMRKEVSIDPAADLLFDGQVVQ